MKRLAKATRLDRTTHTLIEKCAKKKKESSERERAKMNFREERFSNNCYPDNLYYTNNETRWLVVFFFLKISLKIVRCLFRAK